MNITNRYFISSQGQKIFTFTAMPEGLLPKGIVQIVHGLDEHSYRYLELTERLVNAGYIVCADDHRGFGRSAITDDLRGHIADEDGYNYIISDMMMLRNNIRVKYSDLPYFMFGHSMGSLLARCFILRYPDALDGVILSATKGFSSPIEKFGLMIANIQKALFGNKKRAHMLNSLMAPKKNKINKEENSKFAWLTSDRAEWLKVMEDKYFSKRAPTVETFIQLLKLTREIESKEANLRVSKNLPILFVSGDKDALGDFTEGVLEVVGMYKELGVKDVSYKFFENGRHEVFNDVQRVEASNYIISWLDDKVKVLAK